MATALPAATTRGAVLREAQDATRAAWGSKQQELEGRAAAARAAVSDLEAQGAASKRWLRRLWLDARDAARNADAALAAHVAELDTKLHDVARITTEYHDAIESASRAAGGRMISTSAHAATRSARRGNVVTVTPETAEECLRQSMRAALGLQDAPLLLTAGDVCDECGVQMLVVSNDSMLSCPTCHKLRVLPNTMTTSALHGTDVEVSNAITKHRLPEWIEMAQAKEFAEPPPDVLDVVARFLIEHKMTGLEEHLDAIAAERAARGPFRSATDAAERLRDAIPDLETRLQSINSSAVRVALKGLVTDGADKYRKFYERSAKVAALVSGWWPPRMTAHQEEVLRMMYTVAAPKYEQRRKPKQTYWPGGFPFFLRSVCVLLGWDEFAAQFPIPSGSKEGGSRDTLRNEIWAELGWELVPYTGTAAPIRLPDGTDWALPLDDDVDDDDEGRATARAVRKEVSAKINIKKRRRVDFELSCA